MSFKSLVAGAFVAACLPLSLLAAGHGTIEVIEPYARSASPAAKSGAAFMQIINTGTTPDRLLDVRSDRAAKVELHAHKDMGNGVMTMLHVTEGWQIAPGETLLLERGGNHVMMMGLTGPMETGEVFAVTLVFEVAGEIVLEVPVDQERMPMRGGMTHGN